MPVYHNNKWSDIQDLYKDDRDELKRIIEEIVASDYSDFDQFDNIPIRTWLKERTDSDGIILMYEALAMLEYMTVNHWWDHSASEFLYTRKLHYGERHMAGYSIWPKGGYVNLCVTLADVIAKNGGRIETGVAVSNVLIEDYQVVGVEVEREPRLFPDYYPETEAVNAPNVICTLPVWNMLEVLPEEHLPEWYVGQIKYLARDENRSTWFGYYAALEEPVYISSPLELAAWMEGPVTGLAGFAFLPSTLDAEVAPDGKHLICCGVTAAPWQIADNKWLRKKFKEFDEEMDLLYPQLKKKLIWKKRNVVWNYNVIQKPGLVGMHRPDNKVPNINGLWLAGDTCRSRQIGTDRSARSAITVAEGILGARIPEFKNSWHY
jgi:phytoene dehydrogenase-like protein